MSPSTLPPDGSGHRFARVGALVALVITAVAFAGCASTETRTVTVGAAGAAPTSSSEPEPGVPVPASQRDSDDDGATDDVDYEPNNPDVQDKPQREEEDSDGEFNLSCDYLLGDDLGDYTLVADGTLTNTGNIGIRVEAVFTWPQAGADDIEVTRTYRIPRDGEKDVDISLPATSDQIDRLQSSANECDFDVTIVDTYGKTPYEDQ